jgi:polyphenol oxidase
MPFHQSEAIRYFTFDSFNEAGITHAVFTRQGGISPQPWASLNLGGTVGDDPIRVAKNRELIFHAIGRLPETMYDVWQVHSTEVTIAKAPRRPDEPHQRSDVILTQNPDVTLLMRFADCVPILLYDPGHQAVGIVHSGWPGTVRRVVQAAIKGMCLTFGTHPEDILAAIGPSIGAHHYEIGPDVENQVRESFGRDAPAFLLPFNGRLHFDLWAANQFLLENCGVRKIETADLCTACHLEDWYSHRGEHGQTGRFGVLICLNH